MKTVFHRASERGVRDTGCLSTHYSFSFSDWYRSDRMGFGALRVLNDDVIAPLGGFPMHGHRDMEIITLVTKGEITHADSLGNQATISEGEVQVMSAGTGVIHSEKNNSTTDPLSLFQIWIKPRARDFPPRYAKKQFDFSRAGLTLLVSPDAVQGSLPVYQEAWISYARASKGETLQSPAIGPTQGLYLFVIEGTWSVGGVPLGPRDALGICEVSQIDLTAQTDATALLIEVPLGQNPPV